MPCLRGKEPTSRAQWASLKALFGSSVSTRSWSVAKEQSSSSMPTPSSAGMACGISNSCKTTLRSGPNTSPEARRPSMAYAT